ncbi:hypothetical protein EBR25_13385, partial [bacterium]|nr:hypothetical protein [bacterium]
MTEHSALAQTITHFTGSSLILGGLTPESPLWSNILDVVQDSYYESLASDFGYDQCDFPFKAQLTLYFPNVCSPPCAVSEKMSSIIEGSDICLFSTRHCGYATPYHVGNIVTSMCQWNSTVSAQSRITYMQEHLQLEKCQPLFRRIVFDSIDS